MAEHRIHISDFRRPAAWRRKVYALLYPMVFIGTGALLDSTAMQWFGFVAVVVALIVAAIGDKGSNLTIAQARAYLDKLEGE